MILVKQHHFYFDECWRREYISKSGDFTKKREVSLQKQELKSLKKELRNVTMERDILKKAVSIFSKSDS